MDEHNTKSRLVPESSKGQSNPRETSPHFMNAAEEAFARLLDFYGIPWEYEPRTFILRTDPKGHVLEAFTPDFYLPEQDLYIEITTMNPRQIRQKNRKIRLLKERYPHINIRLFRRRDIAYIFQKYGDSPPSEQDKEP